MLDQNAIEETAAARSSSEQTPGDPANETAVTIKEPRFVNEKVSELVLARKLL
jgi:hypothetical protein